jgi:hypothetical protein
MLVTLPKNVDEKVGNTLKNVEKNVGNTPGKC